MRIPFGKPFPAIDSTSLRDGVAAGLVNGFINELDDYESMLGHTAFATNGVSSSVDSLYETLNGVILAVINGAVVQVNSDGTFTSFSGDTVTAGVYCYWAEDGQNVYLAHGGKLARVDVTNHIVTLLSENTPSAVTHVCRSKGFLFTNGNDIVITSSPFSLSQTFDDASSLDAVVTLTDKPGWIIATGRRTASPNALGRIYLSKDNGLSWTRVYAAPANSFILALEYMGSGVVLAGTGVATGRILQSTDYGETWTDLGQLGSSGRINCIRRLATSTLIAGTGSGTSLGKVFRSTNNGLTWSALGTDFGKQVSEAEPMTADGATVVIATVSNADAIVLWRSTDTGASFSSIQTLSGAGFVPAIQRVSDTIAILSNGATSTTSQKVWRSVNAGLTWADIGTIPDFPGDALPFAFCLTSDDQLLMATAGNNVGTGGAQVWKSNDAGVTWQLVAILNDDKAAAIQQRGLKETHVAGTVVATGRVDLGNDGVATAAKWQTGLGRNAPQGDIFFSEDYANSYERVDSWERFNAQSVPDACNGVFQNRGLVYSTGPRSIEINYNSGNATIPWAVSDPSLPFGLLAPNSWVAWDELDTVMYLTNTDKGIKVVQFQGRTQHGISTVYDAVLNNRSLVTTPENAKAWGITVRGLPFYVISFQEDDLTLVYNLKKDHWFRWGYWNGSSYEAALINSYCYSKAQNKHFIGDRRANGKIYTMDETSLSDAGDAIRFELTSGWVNRGTDWPKFCARLLGRFKRGAAIDTSTPAIALSMRDDGRTSFSTERSGSLGITGDTEFYITFNRLGMYRARQWRVTALLTKTRLIFAGADES